jgi:TatD DNase family protein
MFIDTHCHLNFQAFEKDLHEVIQRAKEKNIGKIIIPGAKLDSSKKAFEIAQKYPDCFAAIGIHPHHIDEYKKNGPKKILDAFAPLLRNKKVVALGETGLDYHTYKNCPSISSEDKKNQKELFLLHLTIAHKYNFPVIIHCRDAQQDMLEILTEFTKQCVLRGVMHCFDGDGNYLKQILSLGLFVGFDGNSTYPDNIHLQQRIQETPLDKMLLETDAPYLTPIPHRGTRNDPSFIIHTAAFISSLLHKPLEYIAKTTTENASVLFQLGPIV